VEGPLNKVSQFASRDLSCFFSPTSIAVVGASDDAAKWGHVIAKQALRSTKRPVYLINSRSSEVLGHQTFARLVDVPTGPDVAVLAVPVKVLSESIDDALAAGVKGLIVITAGLGEVDGAGIDAQRDIVTRVRAAGAALIGPNCLGLVDNANEVFLASNAFEVGSVALLSQSGNLALELQEWFADFNLGFSRFISIGNQADVTLVDLIENSIDDPNTKAIAIYVEDFNDGRGFVKAARRAHDVGKPVVVLAAGSSGSASRSAQSHTGALTSDRRVIEAACELAGVSLVNTPRELVIALQAGLQPRRANGSRVGVVTDGGGHATVASDLLEARGFLVPSLSAETQADLRSHLWPQSTVANPVDLAGYGEQDPNSYADVVIRLLHESDIDAVLMSGYFGGYSSPNPFAQGLDQLEIAAARSIAEAVMAQNKPLSIQTMYPDSPAIAELSAVGVTAHNAIEDAIASLTHSKSLVLGELPNEIDSELPIEGLTYCDLMPVIESKGITTPGMRVVKNREEVIQAAEAFTAPYVLKANGLLHKTDLGGVALNLVDRENLLSEFDRMRAQIDASSYSVEPMVDSINGVELIVGLTQDPRFGAVLLVGMGGIFTEVLKDSVLALAPVGVEKAREMLLSLKGSPLLCGHRGRPAVDIESAAKAIAKLSSLAAAHPEWSEFEVNPLLVTPNGATALDVRVAL